MSIQIYLLKKTSVFDEGGVFGTLLLPERNDIQLPRICKKRNSDKEEDHDPNESDEKKLPLTWIMFMGDSNMRHTYYWWTTKDGQKHGVKGSTYGMDRRDLGYGGRWADQEILFLEGAVNINSMNVSRYSFRFLHGSVEEFVHSANHWDIARRAAPSPSLEDVAKVVNDTNKEQVQQQGKKNNDKSHSATAAAGDDRDDSMWEGRIRPSDFALWATQYQQPINDNSKDFMSLMKKWENKTSPDVVILTQGWGGVPRSDEIGVVRTIVKNNPETLFIWSPLYVTDHAKARYDSYNESGIFSWSEPNLRILDLWHMAMTLPNPTKGLHHISVGGKYMREAMEKIWREVTICATGVTV